MNIQQVYVLVALGVALGALIMGAGWALRAAAVRRAHAREVHHARALGITMALAYRSKGTAPNVNKILDVMAVTYDPALISLFAQEGMARTARTAYMGMASTVRSRMQKREGDAQSVEGFFYDEPLGTPITKETMPHVSWIDARFVRGKGIVYQVRCPHPDHPRGGWFSTTTRSRETATRWQKNHDAQPLHAHMMDVKVHRSSDSCPLITYQAVCADAAGIHWSGLSRLSAVAAMQDGSVHLAQEKKRAARIHESAREEPKPAPLPTTSPITHSEPYNIPDHLDRIEQLVKDIVLAAAVEITAPSAPTPTTPLHASAPQSGRPPRSERADPISTTGIPADYEPSGADTPPPDAQRDDPHRHGAVQPPAPREGQNTPESTPTAPVEAPTSIELTPETVRDKVSAGVEDAAVGIDGPAHIVRVAKYGMWAVLCREHPAFSTWHPTLIEARARLIRHLRTAHDWAEPKG